MATKKSNPTNETPNPVGRPSSYDPIYCARVIELGAQGKSLEQISAQLLVSYRTLCTWREKHSEFLHAIEEAHRLSQAWWEDKAQEHIIEGKDDSKINAGLWAKIMAARFPATYRENQKVELSGTVDINHANEAMEQFLATLDKKVASA